MVSQSLLEKVASTWHCISPPPRPQLTLVSLPYTTPECSTHPTPGPWAPLQTPKCSVEPPSNSSNEVIALLSPPPWTLYSCLLGHVLPLTPCPHHNCDVLTCTNIILHCNSPSPFLSILDCELLGRKIVILWSAKCMCSVCQMKK